MRGAVPWESPSPGRNRYAIARWEIDPRRTALLLVDLQEGHTRTDVGWGPRLQNGHPEIAAYYYARLEATVLPNVRRLVAFARSEGLQVIFTRHGAQLPGGRDLTPWHWQAQRERQGGTGRFPRGSAEYALRAEWAPTEADLVLDKNTLSPFNSTPLDQCLRNIGLENLLIAGRLTNAAVESTARSAGDRGFNAMVVEDACAAFHPSEHEASLRLASWWVRKTTEAAIAEHAALLAR